MQSRASILARIVLFGFLWFVGAALVIGGPLCAFHGWRMCGGGDSVLGKRDRIRLDMPAFFRTTSPWASGGTGGGSSGGKGELVETPEGFRYKSAVADESLPVVAVVHATFGTLETGRPFPVFQRWTVAVSLVEPSHDCKVPATNTAYWTRATVQARCASQEFIDKNFPGLSSQDVLEELSTGSMERTNWLNAGKLGAVYMWHSPWWIAALAVTCALLSAFGAWIGTCGVRRVRRGCCRACGYDLTGCAAPVCPECGAPACNTSPVASATIADRTP